MNGSVGMFSSASSRNYKDRSWVITTPVNHNIQLRFTTFQLSESQKFGTNRIQIYDGKKSEEPKLLGDLTGTRRPFTIQSSGRFMLVKLTKKYAFSLSNVQGVWSSSTTKSKLFSEENISIHTMGGNRSIIITRNI